MGKRDIGREDVHILLPQYQIIIIIITKEMVHSAAKPEVTATHTI